MTSLSEVMLLGKEAAAHGDLRLGRRQSQIQQALAVGAGTGASIPSLLKDSSAIEGYYRFVRNPNVEVKALIQPHIDEVFAQPFPKGPLLLAHDTTKVSHESAVDSPDMYDLGTGRRGYLVHTTLLIDAIHNAPIGVGHLEVVEPKSEQPEHHLARRWERAVEAVAPRVQDHHTVIHLMDSEADSYPLMACVLRAKQHFIIRDKYNRRVCLPGAPKEESLLVHDLIAAQPSVGQLTVHLSARKREKARPKDKARKERKERDATLDIRFIRVEVPRPKGKRNAGLPERLELTFIEALEVDPPEDQDPIQWRLWTDLEVSSLAQAILCVGYYQMRWRIEELFAALKGGCGFGDTCFESRATSSRAMALWMPIAVGLLRLRQLGTQNPDAEATTVLKPYQLRVLAELEPKLPKNPKAGDVFKSIARLGGHLPQNKRIGWKVLGRGLHHLLVACAGFKAAFKAPLDAMERASVNM